MKKNSLLHFAMVGCFVVATFVLSAAFVPGVPFQAQTPMQASMARGKQVYSQVCLPCHQADAGGVLNMNPPLIKTTYVLGAKAPLIKIVLNGMTGTVTIDGDDYHNAMAPHSDLSDQQIADVLTFVRNNFGNKASAVSVAQVKAVRAAYKPAGK